MDPLDELIGENPKIVALRQTARTLLRRNESARRLPPILIEGETGTGKGFLARLMQRTGPRANAPFVDINCAAIPETLLEAELFGYERGAFTDARQSKPGLFHVAHGGTLFLDEVGLLPRGLQAKLLTALEQGSVRRLGATRNEVVNVSIMAATNKPLLAAVRKGSFREDLYHRLAVLILELPPLRERPEDVEPLTERMLARIYADYNLPPRKLTEDARGALTAYDWPGNVRELRNILERAVLLSDTGSITADALDLPLRRRPADEGGRAETPPSSEETSRGETNREGNNRERLVEALARTGWNISRTAALLDITRNTVRARMRLYGLRPPAAAGLEAAPSPPASAVTPTGAEHAVGATVADVRWERRRLTFLRARIVGPADASPSVTTPVLTLIIEKIQTFGGYVSEIGQHGIGAIFGHQPAEDAPRRAATAALAIARLLAPEQPSADVRRDVSATLAIHVDRVALARIDGRPVVDAAAARQAMTALDDLEPIGAGEIGVSASAVGFLMHHFDVKPAGPDVHGGSHRLVGRWVVPGGPHAISFIGRRPEIDLLHGLLDRAMVGQGQIVTLVGEPGIGKSRLLHEFQQSVRHGIVMLEGRCASYARHVPYFPVIEILKTAWEIEDTDTIEVVDAKVRAALRPLGEAAVASAPYLQYLLLPRKTAELSARSPDAIKAATFEASRRILLAQQEQRPVLLAIEDLHWIDETSAELLASLAQLTMTARVLLLTTSRPVYHAPWQTRSNATQIAIGPLSVAESRQLVKSVLVARPVTETVVARILDRGEGNPFFLEELARSVEEQPDDAVALAVPGTVHDIIAARVDGLAAADKHVLDVAAVIGREVSGSLLEDTCERSVDDVRGSLRRLQAGEFLYATRLGVDSAYTFKHALTHEVAYDSVALEARRRLHARVVTAIEKLAPEIRERRPETLAYHCTEAGRHAEAIEHWYRAGQLAIQRSAHGDALVHLGQALGLLAGQPESPARDAQEVAMQLAMAMSLTAARGYGAPEVERTLTRIRELADRLTDVTQKFFVHWSAWRFQFSRANFRAAEELVAQLLAIAADHGDRLMRVGAHLAAGVDRFYLGEFAPAREHLAQAIALYDRAESASQTLRYGQDMGVAAWGFLGWADAVVGDLEGAARRADTMLQLAREIRHPFTLALALFAACEIGELREDATTVKSLGEELIAVSREHAFAFFVAIGMSHTGWAIGRMGDVSGGAAMMQEGADLFRAVGQRVGLAHRARLADGLLAAGSVDAALDVIADAMERQRETGEHAFVSTLLSVRGEALAKRGDLEGARQSLQEAIEVANQQGAALFARHAEAALRRLEDAR
jgi:DNA-binding NtrC family response regulator/tetratricopeptide (TPR) repeat protein